MVLCVLYSLPSDVVRHRAVRIGKFPSMKCLWKCQALHQVGYIHSMQSLSLSFQTLFLEVKQTLAATGSGPSPQRCCECRRGPRNVGKDGIILAAAVTALGWKDPRVYAVSPGREGLSAAQGFRGQRLARWQELPGSCSAAAAPPPAPPAAAAARPRPRGPPRCRSVSGNFQPGSAAGRGQGRRLRRPVPGGCPRRWGGREGEGKSAGSRAAARRVTWRGAEGPPAAQRDEEEAPPALPRWAPGGPWPAARCLLSLLSPVLTAVPAWLCSLRPAAAGWEPASRWAGLGSPRSSGVPREAVPGPAPRLCPRRRQGLPRLSPAASPGSGRDAGFAAAVLPGSSWPGKGCPWQQSERNLQAQLVALAQRVLVGKGGAAFVAFGFEVTHVRAEPGTRPGQGTVAGRLGSAGGQHENTG